MTIAILFHLTSALDFIRFNLKYTTLKTYNLNVLMEDVVPLGIFFEFISSCRWAVCYHFGNSIGDMFLVLGSISLLVL